MRVFVPPGILIISVTVTRFHTFAAFQVSIQSVAPFANELRLAVVVTVVVEPQFAV